MIDQVQKLTFLDQYDEALVDIRRRKPPLEEHLRRLSQAVKLTPYAAARLSWLLEDVLHEENPPPLPVGLIDVLAEFIVELVLPACWGDEYENKPMRTAGKMVLEAFCCRPELTGTAITTVLAGFLETAYPSPEIPGERSSFIPEAFWTILTLFRSPACPVSVAGSFWRVVMYRDPRVAFEMNGALLAAPTVPVEVVARAHGWMQNLLPRWTGLELGGNLARMDICYPDLADLPKKMKFDVIASQPVPVEWFNAGLMEPEWVTELVPSC